MINLDGQQQIPQNEINDNTQLEGKGECEAADKNEEIIPLNGKDDDEIDIIPIPMEESSQMGLSGESQQQQQQQMHVDKRKKKNENGAGIIDAENDDEIISVQFMDKSHQQSRKPQHVRAAKSQSNQRFYQHSSHSVEHSSSPASESVFNLDELDLDSRIQQYMDDLDAQISRYQPRQAQKQHQQQRNEKEVRLNFQQVVFDLMQNLNILGKMMNENCFNSKACTMHKALLFIRREKGRDTDFLTLSQYGVSFRSKNDIIFLR